MSEIIKAKLDTFLSRWTSRKLMVFFITVGLNLAGKVESSDFIIIAAIYIGGQTIIDAVKLRQSK
jgi:hypothetical protein